MLKIIKNETLFFLTSIADELNEAYAEGYRFACEGNFDTYGTDPQSGMPNVSRDVFLFSDYTEAKQFSKTQLWPFNGQPMDKVIEIPSHTDTWEEIREKEEKEKAERKAKKLAKDTAKAEALGMTLEEWKKMKSLEKAFRDTNNYIVRLEKELAEAKADAERLKKKLEKF